MSCIYFFTRHCNNYNDLFNNLNYLTKARKHLEQYLELCSMRQFSQSSQQQLTWKQKSDTASLCRPMSTQEVDK